ncbi:hypothetical protein CP98_03654 [Sphingobium yanoikuyae]|uniref:Bacteriophage tail tape measure N-terminal domain-containing protein n=1 Tax=Sphingobium yanoikuyae TaxID=13690 RepID=A0A084EGR4_SPHYA|nr:hypothetical protein [Sphingobium yanoikuyae]KEZ17156.1 hypothetical protein CP98_03654 [Sphingobium yanoikuyae]
MAEGTPLELIAVEVRADLAQLERGMNGAVRVVDQATGQIDRDINATERNISVAGRNIERSLGGGSGAARVFGQQIGQMGQQVVAGTNVLQALAIQLPDIAAGMGSAGGAAGRFASILGGPWGLAVTTAISLAVAFIPNILGMGDAAEESTPKIDRMTRAVLDLAAAQGKVENQKYAEAQLKLLQQEAALRKLDEDIASSQGTRAALQRRIALQARRDTLQAQVEETRAVVAGTEKRLEAQRKLDAAGTSSGGSTSGGAARSGRVRSPSGQPEADRLAKEKEQLDKRYTSTLQQFELEQRLADIRAKGTLEAQAEADRMEVIAKIQQQFPELVNSTLEADKERLAVLERIATATIDAAYGRRADKEASDAALKAAREDEETRRRVADDMARKQEMDIRNLASIYEDAFLGGNRSIFDNFKEIGIRAISELLAKWTLGQAGSEGASGGGINGFLMSAAQVARSFFQASGGGETGTGVGFASGGTATLGGRGGTDRNTLSLNGRPIANVTRGETLSVGSKALRGGGGGATVNQYLSIDARNSVTPEGFARDILTLSGQQAQQAAGAMGKAVTKVVPARLAQYSRDGT